MKIDADKAKGWSDKDILIQWHKGFKGILLTPKLVKGEDLNKFEHKTVNDGIARYRQRLVDISWFMRSLCEPITRMANKEDKCTGRFYSLPPPSGQLKLFKLIPDKFVERSF